FSSMTSAWLYNERAALFWLVSNAALKSWIATALSPFASRCWAVAISSAYGSVSRSEEHTSELQSRFDLVCRLLLERKKNTMRRAHADGWIIVFDTLKLADDRLDAFYANPNAFSDYVRDIDRMVLASVGRKANDSHS